MPSPGINRLLLTRTRISGIPFPGEFLRANGIWYRNGEPIGYGAGYSVSVRDIGAVIRCGNSHAVRVWHPRDVPQCHAAWVSWLNVFNTLPDTLATHGQPVRQWRDIIRGINANQTNAIYQPIWSESGGPGGLPAVVFNAAATQDLFTDPLSDLAGNAFEGIMVAFRATSLASNQTPFGTMRLVGSNHSRLVLRASRSSASDKAFAIVDRSANSVATAQLEFPNNGTDWSAGYLISNWSTGDVKARINAGTVYTASNPDTGVTVNQPAYYIGSVANIPASSTYHTGPITCAMGLVGEPGPRDFNRLHQFLGLCAGQNLGLPIL